MCHFKSHSDICFGFTQELERKCQIGGHFVARLSIFMKLNVNIFMRNAHFLSVMNENI